MVAIVAAVLLADVKHDIEANYEKMAAAMHRKDADAAGKFLAPEYTRVLKGKPVNRAQFIEFERKALGRVTSVDTSRKIVSLTVKGPEAIVICQIATKTVLPGPDAKPHHFDTQEKREDIWAKHGNAWLLRHVQVLKEQALLDGKPASIPGAGSR